MADQFTLYGSFLSGPTYKVGLMLALTGQPYAYRHVDLSKAEQKSPEFLKLNRFGQVPVLVHERATQGSLPLVQSCAIIEYLADLSGRFGGKDAAERQQAREWLHWDVDRLMPWMNRARFYARFVKPDPAVVEHARKAAATGLDMLESLLEGRTFLLESGPSIADIGLFSSVVHAAEAEFDLDEYPNIQAWWKRIAALPGFKLPYDLLPKS
ncbi:glutathione S-transferase family protein [Ferrovibrio sp.]|uniref:glutathione S-transferase family protein n=1 Tax=Ferrovibrio sp. TaxID=1917215 RepID=UPI0025B8D92A|nr:glutathione S-transferase family protein [Ferrovibrio sp.]MBX3453398.1 glutathione S-transferase family protein [Ferrovibrio sp.]